MNKEEIKHFKAMLRQGSLRHMNILLDDKFQKELLNIIKDYEKLQQENQQLKEQKERLKNCYSSMTIIGRQQGRAYEEAKRYISVCDLLGLKDIKITLVDSEDKKRIAKVNEFLKEYHKNKNMFKWNEQDYIDVIEKIEELLKR